ncbi:hypothetical protein FB451DRAFT_1403336 [Mycena latifolia]|nr:hypothetical protein FB451DRAFT_1403336 [Mycena latifolia]
MRQCCSPRPDAKGWAWAGTTANVALSANPRRFCSTRSVRERVMLSPTSGGHGPRPATHPGAPPPRVALRVACSHRRRRAPRRGRFAYIAALRPNLNRFSYDVHPRVRLRLALRALGSAMRMPWSARVPQGISSTVPCPSGRQLCRASCAGERAGSASTPGVPSSRQAAYGPSTCPHSTIFAPQDFWRKPRTRTAVPSPRWTLKSVAAETISLSTTNRVPETTCGQTLHTRASLPTASARIARVRCATAASTSRRARSALETTSVRMPTPAFCYATPPPFVASVVPLRGPARSNTSRPPRSGCLRSLMTPAPDCSVSTAPWRLGPCIRLHCPLSHRSAAACDDERAAARLLSCRRDLLPRILITPYRLLTHLHLPACSTSASGPLPDEAPPLKPTESPLGCLSSTARHVIAILTHRNLYTSFRLQPPARRRASGHDDRGVPSSTAFPCISASVYTRLLRHPLSSSPAASMHADRRPHLHGLLFLMLACMRLRYQASAPRSSSCKAPLPQIIPPPPPR